MTASLKGTCQPGNKVLVYAYMITFFSNNKNPVKQNGANEKFDLFHKKALRQQKNKVIALGMHW